jgi:hypothetical protein
MGFLDAKAIVEMSGTVGWGCAGIPAFTSANRLEIIHPPGGCPGGRATTPDVMNPEKRRPGDGFMMGFHIPRSRLSGEYAGIYRNIFNH